MNKTFWVMLMFVGFFWLGWSLGDQFGGHKPTPITSSHSYQITYPACPDSSVKATIADMFGDSMRIRLDANTQEPEETTINITYSPRGLEEAIKSMDNNYRH